MQFKEVLANIARTSLVLGAMSVSAFVSADDYNHYNYNGNGGWNNNCCPTNCCPQVCCDEAPQCAFGYNPPAHQKCGCNPCGGFCDNLSGRVDFLWWRPCAEGTQLGTFDHRRSNNDGPIVIDEEKTSVKDVNFKFDAGFRLGLGYYCPSNCWDIALNWTHFHSKAKTRAFGNDGDDLFVSDWNRGFGFYPDEIESRWTLDLDLIDLEFAQKFYVNHCFVLRPHFGLRFARVDQSYHVESESFTSSSFNLYDSFQSFSKSTNDFKGIGPRVGLDIEINLGCNFVLFGKGAASLVYGKFDRSSHENILASVPQGAGEDVSVNGFYEAKGFDDRCTVTMTDISFGLKWEHCFECCNVYHPFALSVAWEQNAFYDLNHFNFVPGIVANQSNFTAGSTSSPSGLISASPAKTGHLTTQGVTVSAVVGF